MRSRAGGPGKANLRELARGCGCRRADEVPRGPRVHGMRATCASLLVAWVLAGCAGSPAPATIWMRLSTEAPALAAGGTGPACPAVSAPAAPGEAWQLMLPVVLPGHLDRDALFVPQGASGAWVRPLEGARWVEPLRDAVPRVLREDLMRALGGQVVWWPPLPPGVLPTRQLRAEFVAFEIGADGRALTTQVRWTLADARGARAPAVHEARIATPVAGPGGAEGWALAHRLAIAELSCRIAATLVAWPAAR